MRRVVVVVCVTVLFCFGFGLLQAGEMPNEKPKAAEQAKTAKPAHPKKPKAKKKPKPTPKVQSEKTTDKAKDAKATLKTAKENTAKAEEATAKAAKDKKAAETKTVNTTFRPGTPGVHEPQAVSDAQLREARQLLTGPPSVASLKTAHRLLVEANHDYDGHRHLAAEATKKAIEQYASAPNKAVGHIKRAIGEINTALSIR